MVLWYLDGTAGNSYESMMANVIANGCPNCGADYEHPIEDSQPLDINPDNYMFCEVCGSCTGKKEESK